MPEERKANYRSAFIGFTKDAKQRADSVFDALKQIGLESKNIFQFTKSPERADVAEAAQEVDTALRNSDAFILIYSAGSRASEWVNSELGQVKALQKPLFLFKNTHNIAIDMPEFMANYDYQVIGRLDSLSKYFRA